MSRRAAATRRLLLIGLGLVLCLALASLLHPRVRYVAVAATYQLELLWGRVPVEEAIAAGHFTEEEVATLRRVPAIKAHARQLGLADTGHYSTINPHWDHTVWNVSACEELAFRPVRWWFPIVGRVPYLGFFDEEAARATADELRSAGHDVHVRTAGAWSTLGWFEDPLLPHMARWSEARLADTLHHELTHATVWIPGSVAFNESLANFVGRTAAMRYLETTWGPDSDEVAAERRRRADRQVYLDMMRAVYGELDAVYTDPSLSEADKRSRKAAILEGLPDRARAAGFSDPARWARWFEEQPWNNARLVQFRVYNRSPAWFEAVLEQEGGDLAAFLARIEALAAQADDPYRALAEAAGVDPATLEDDPVR
jgi:predicted aminopeptidase